MKRFTAGLIAAALLGIGATGSAQDDEEVPERFINIVDALRIEGGRLRPADHLVTARSRAEFESLLTMRRSFVGEIIESAEEMVFE